MLASARDKVTSVFRDVFGRQPEITTAAPGRVNLIGEHIDYNDGIVLPFAIDRYTVITGATNPQSQSIRFHSGLFNQTESVRLSDFTSSEGCWYNYLIGVVAGFQALGYSVPAFDVAIDSSIPTGAGLSSSAALEVALATFIEQLLNIRLPKSEKALLCQTAEREFAGVPCGIMDQFASVFGEPNRLVKIDCESKSVEMIDLANFDDLEFLIVNTEAPHKLADGEYAIRRQQSAEALAAMNLSSYRQATQTILNDARTKMSDRQFHRGRHVISEIERTQTATRLAQQGRWLDLGELMYQSHASLRDDFEVSCPELDFLVDSCKGIGVEGGVYGSRMTGGGFGGCTITLAQSREVENIITKIQNSFADSFSRTPPAFSTTPSNGAHVIT